MEKRKYKGRVYIEPVARTRNVSRMQYLSRIDEIKLSNATVLEYWKEIRDKYYSWTLDFLLEIFNNAIDSELEFEIKDYRDFIKSHFYLSKEYTPYAGAVDIGLNIWLKPSLFNAIVGKEPETVIIKKSSQLGFTTIMLILSFIFILKNKQSVLYVLPTDKIVNSFWHSKVKPLIRYSDNLKKWILNMDEQSHIIETTRGNLIFSYATSPTALASHSTPIAILDEVAKYKVISDGNPIELAKERAKAYKNKKFILFSTPSIVGNIFEDTFSRYPQKVFHIYCDECNKKFPLDFKDFKNIEIDGIIHCVYETPCQHKRYYTPQDLCDNGDYEFIDNSDNLSFNGVSFVIPSFLSSFLSFDDIMRKYNEISINASKETLQSFENNYLAKTFDHSVLRMKVNLMNLNEQELKNEMSKPNIKLFTGIDVGEDNIYVVSFITDIENDKSNLLVVDFCKIELKEFTEILDKVLDYNVFGFKPVRIGIDFGYKTNELRLLFRHNPNIIPIRGRTTETLRNQKILYNSNTHLVEIYSHFFKTKIATLMQNERLFFWKTSQRLIKHLASHECYVDPKDGTILWKSKFSEGYEDHYLDALLYAYISYYIALEV